MAAYITASRLRDGVAVWRGSDQAWATDIAEAALFDGDALEATIALTEAEEAQHIVLDVHPAPTMPRRVSTWPTGVTRKGFLARSSRPRRSLRARACW